MALCYLWRGHGRRSSVSKCYTCEWGLGNSAQLGYLQAITDLIDFRKSSGLSATVLGNFAVSEVYINRGKRALAKRKITEWSKNLSIEVLAASNQWAMMDEMEQVIPFHLPRYKDVLTRCKGYPFTAVKPSDLTFATRFVAVYLFTRVKGSASQLNVLKKTQTLYWF